MTSVDTLRAARESGNLDTLIDAIPYARLLGIRMHAQEAGIPTFILPRAEKNIGNPLLPALHGGVIGGFLETCALLHVVWMSQSMAIPKIIDLSIDYLRTARVEDTFGLCRISRLGQRVAHVQVDAWQRDREKPIALVRAHLLLGEDGRKTSPAR